VNYTKEECSYKFGERGEISISCGRLDIGYMFSTGKMIMYYDRTSFERTSDTYIVSKDVREWIMDRKELMEL
jgi:hypothetical protein